MKLGRLFFGLGNALTTFSAVSLLVGDEKAFIVSWILAILCYFSSAIVYEGDSEK